MAKLASVDAANVDRLAKDVVILYVASAAGIGAIVAERNAANKVTKRCHQSFFISWHSKSTQISAP